MPDVTVKEMRDFDAVFGGGMRRVRAGLGVTSFGMQVIELPAGFTGYPAHDHTHETRKRSMSRSGEASRWRSGGTSLALEPGMFARVGPGETRKLIAGDEPVRILCVGRDARCRLPAAGVDGGGQPPAEMGPHGEDKRRATPRAIGRG